jgi:preprotein translocase subunit SecD
MRSISLALLASLLAVATSLAQPVVLNVISAEAGHDQRTGKPMVMITLGGISGQQMMALTSKHVGEKMALRVNGRVLASVVIREPLVARFQMSDSRWSEQDAEQVAGQVSKAELVFPFSEEPSK